MSPNWRQQDKLLFLFLTFDSTQIKILFIFKLSKLTIPQLKEFMKSKNIKCSGTKKQDLIDAINEAI